MRKSAFRILVLASVVFQSCGFIDLKPGITAGALKNWEPVAADLSITTNRNIVATSTLSATDKNKDALTYSVVTAPILGTVTITDPSTGAFAYTPKTNAPGADSFTYQVSDGKADSNTATVAVTIVNSSNAPVAAAIAPANLSEDISSGTIPLSYTDIDADKATECSVSNLQHVTVTQACACDDAGVCTLKVTGTQDYDGPASFDYAVTSDGQQSNTAAASFTITSVNDAPTISDIADTSTNEDAAKVVNFTITDAETAVACNSTSLSLVSDSASVVADSSVVWSGTAPHCTATIAPVADAFGAATLAIHVTDTALGANDSFVLTVNQLADDPFSWSLTFDALSEALYTYSSSLLRFTAGILELIAADQVDSDNTATGFAGGTLKGVAWDGTKLKIGDSGGCDATSTNCAELDESWAPQWANLVAYWKMNGNWDDSKGTNTGTAAGNASFSSSRKLGSHAGVFDGIGDYVEGPNNDALDVAGPVTILAWVKLSDAPVDYSEIVDRENCSDSGFSLIVHSDRKVQFWIGNGTDFFGVQDASTPMQDGVWYQIAGVFDGSSIKVYVNGIQEGSAVAQTGMASLTGVPVRLGAFNTCGSGRDFNGHLDDVAIWATSLSSAELQTIYNRQSAKYAGTFTSRVMDAGASDASWTTLSWLPTLPFFKALPDYSGGIQHERSTDYSSLVDSTGAVGANGLMTGAVGLWHLNETSWTGNAGEVQDDSGQNNHGSAFNGATTVSGIFGNAGFFNGIDQYLQVPTSSSLEITGDLTIATWINPADFSNYLGILSKASANIPAPYDYYLEAGTGRPVFIRGDGSTFLGANGTSAPMAGQWSHAVVTMSGTDVSFYLNGVANGQGSVSTTIADAGGTLRIGSRDDGGTMFSGSIDEVGIWNRALPANEVQQLYTSANGLMTGIVGLWHLDESGSGTAPGAKDFKDSSGNSRHGVAVNGVSYGRAGKFSLAPVFDDSVDSYIDTGLKMSDHSLETAATYAGWVFAYDMGAFSPFLTGGSGGAMSIEMLGGAFAFWLDTSDGYQFVASSTAVPLRTWTHVAATILGQNIKIYINGALEGDGQFTGTPIQGTTNYWMGHSGAGSGLDRSWRGLMDEVAIWSRPLHASEIKQLYQRGASRLKFQTRTCATNPCTTESWKGPDGTSGTYFSELNNNTAPLAMTGTVKPTLPSMLFDDFGGLPANRYFQYRTIFETDSADLALGPELKSVTVDPVHYPTEASLYGNNGVDFYDLSAFVQTLGAGACSSGIGYNLSLDKSNWKYWNGSSWATANGTAAQSNAATVIGANAATFGTQVGRGIVYIKAFLQSSGTSKCELDKVQVDGAR